MRAGLGPRPRDRGLPGHLPARAKERPRRRAGPVKCIASPGAQGSPARSTFLTTLFFCRNAQLLADSIRPETALVSVMAVNNEIGVVQPLAQIGALCRDRKVFFHTDAAQATGKIPLDVEAMKIDLMSISGHKIYGPKGMFPRPPPLPSFAVPWPAHPSACFRPSHPPPTTPPARSLSMSHGRRHRCWRSVHATPPSCAHRGAAVWRRPGARHPLRHGAHAHRRRARRRVQDCARRDGARPRQSQGALGPAHQRHHLAAHARHPQRRPKERLPWCVPHLTERPCRQLALTIVACAWTHTQAA